MQIHQYYTTAFCPVLKYDFVAMYIKDIMKHIIIKIYMYIIKI